MDRRKMSGDAPTPHLKMPVSCDEINHRSPTDMGHIGREIGEN